MQEEQLVQHSVDFQLRLAWTRENMEPNWAVLVQNVYFNLEAPWAAQCHKDDVHQHLDKFRFICSEPVHVLDAEARPTAVNSKPILGWWLEPSSQAWSLTWTEREAVRSGGPRAS